MGPIDYELMDKVFQIASGYFKNPSLVLFGSRSRGDWQQDSDWDFLVLTEQQITRSIIDEFWGEIYLLGLNYNQVISIIVRNRADWENSVNMETPLYKNITLEGQLYETGNHHLNKISH